MIEDNIHFDCYKDGTGKLYCHGKHLLSNITSKPYDGFDFEEIKTLITLNINKKMAKIKIIENGPAIVEAPVITISLPDGSEVERKDIAAICRCGNSKEGVFCDGTHIKEN